MSQKCPSLAIIDRQHIDFDPTNQEHLEAFRMLCLGINNDHFRQHPTLRFNVAQPFTDVRTMMFHRVGEMVVNAQG
jgi:hypothetical protein